MLVKVCHFVHCCFINNLGISQLSLNIFSVYKFNKQGESTYLCLDFIFIIMGFDCLVLYHATAHCSKYMLFITMRSLPCYHRICFFSSHYFCSRNPNCLLLISVFSLFLTLSLITLSSNFITRVFNLIVLKFVHYIHFVYFASPINICFNVLG